MKKKNINRVMMIIVSLLLALVLLSTSFVSSIYARYVVRDARKFEIGMTKFGVELIMTYKSDWATNGKTVTITPTQNGDSLSVTISDLRMIPGDSFPELVRFEFVEGKTPNVPVKVTITQTLSHDKNNFKIREVNVGNLKKEEFVMPLGFKFAAYDNSEKNVIPMGYVVEPWRLGPESYGVTMNRKLAGNLQAKFGETVSLTDDYTAVEASFKKGEALKFKKNRSDTEPTINQLVFGVEWPETWEGTQYNTGSYLREGATALDYNVMETKLCSQGRDLSVSITYTVKIEQT